MCVDNNKYFVREIPVSRSDFLVIQEVFDMLAGGGSYGMQPSTAREIAERLHAAHMKVCEKVTSPE